MQGEVGIGQPQHRDGWLPLPQDLGTEAAGHGPVACEVMADIERIRPVDRAAPRSEGSGPVIDVTEMLRIKEIGRTGRHVRKSHEPAFRRGALGKRGHAQGRAGSAAHIAAEIRPADIAHHDSAGLQQAHAVAVQPVPRRMAAGGDRGGRYPRDRWKHRAMAGAPQAIAGNPMQDWRLRRGHPVDAEPVAADEDHSARLL
jgi:hypothetical protein